MHKRRSGRFFRETSGSNQSNASLNERFFFHFVGSLDIPKPDFLSKTFDDDALSKIDFFPNDFRISFDGKIAGIIWSNSLLVLYDISSVCSSSDLPLSFASSTSNSQQQSFPVVKFTSFFPLQSTAVNASTLEPIIEYKFHQFSFHPHFPLLFLTLSRRKMIDRVIFQSANNNQKGKSNSVSLSRNPFPVPMSPLIYAIPLFRLSLNLGAVGAFEVNLIDNDGIPGLNSRSSSTNFLPDFFEITPVSGLLLLNFRMYSSLSSSSQSSTASPSFSQQHLLLSFSVDEEWKKSNGFSIFDKILCSSLTFSPDVYLYGLAAASKECYYKKLVDKKDILLQQHSSRTNLLSSYKCLLRQSSSSASSSSSLTERNQLPCCYTIKPVFSLSSGFYFYNLFCFFFAHILFPLSAIQ
jgi:hypothetical protein